MRQLILLLLAACSTEASLGKTFTPGTEPDGQQASPVLGTTRWSIAFGAHDGSGPNAIAFGRDGDVIVGATRWTSNPTAFHAVLTARANADGSERWTRELVGDSQIHAVGVDHAHDIIVVGSFHSRVDFGGRFLSTGPDMPDAPVDLFVAKYSANGTLQWVEALGCTRLAAAATIAIGDDDSIYVGGWFRGQVDFAPPVSESEDQSNGLIAAYSASGVRRWGYGFASNTNISDLVVLPDGDLVAIGGAENRILLARFTPTGANQWIHVQPAIDADLVSAMGLAVSSTSLVASWVESVHVRSYSTTAIYDFAGNETSRTRVADVELMHPVPMAFGRVAAGRVTHAPSGLYLAAYDSDGVPLDTRTFVAPDVYTNAQAIFGLTSRAAELAFVGGLVGPIDFGNGTVSPLGGNSLAIVLLDSAQ